MEDKCQHEFPLEDISYQGDGFFQRLTNLTNGS